MCSVEDEYRKNPELKKEDVERFLEWGKTQPHLPEISGDKFDIFESRRV